MRCVLPLLFLFNVVFSLNILFYNPKNAVSHVRTLGRMADVLAAAGHNVTTLMPLIDSELKTEGTKLSHIIRIPVLKATKEWNREWKTSMVDTIWKGNNKDPFQMLQMISNMTRVVTDQCAATISHPGLLDTLRHTHFDIALAEPMDMCAFSIFHLIGMEKYAVALTTGLMDGIAANLGLPASVSYVPGMMSHFSDKMSFSERALNMISHFASVKIGNIFLTAQDEMNEREGYTDIPPMEEMLAGASLLFVNAEPLVDFPRPTMHKIINIGGISIPKKSTKKLDKEWDSILSLRPQNVLVSFGSVALSHRMPEEFKESLKNVFRRFPNVTFIWKYEVPEDNVAAEIDNVVTNTWTPQQELLADPRMSLFLTHGGMGSTNEAMVNGVPVVAIPVFGDQMRNGKVLERSGTGVVLDKDDLGQPDKVAYAIAAILNDDSYAAKARYTESLLREQPFSPEEKLVKNVEFVARFGPLKQLDAHGRHQSFFQFYMLDVIGAIAVVLFAVVTIIVITARWTLRKCFVKAKQD